ncbi:MAG: hypothetical protein WB996_08505 [Ignavibacteriaceae bacterium]
MSIASVKLLGIIKNIFSFKVLVITIIIILSFLNLFSYNRFVMVKRQKRILQEENLQTMSLLKETSNMEGTHIRDIELKNLSGKEPLNSLYNNKDYIIIIYQNGLVCDPCLEFLTNYWINNSNNFNRNLSRKMIILNNNIDGLVLRYLHSVHMESSYYVDSTNYIHDNIVKIDKPTNFLFFINKSGEIIYSSYFDTETKEHLGSFLNKANRFLDNIN